MTETELSLFARQSKSCGWVPMKEGNGLGHVKRHLEHQEVVEALIAEDQVTHGTKLAQLGHDATLAFDVRSADEVQHVGAA